MNDAAVRSPGGLDAIDRSVAAVERARRGPRRPGLLVDGGRVVADPRGGHRWGDLGRGEPVGGDARAGGRDVHPVRPWRSPPGYHRLFAHRTYRASPPVRWAMLAFGAATFQNSALSWSADHRAHHADTDRRRRSPCRDTRDLVRPRRLVVPPARRVGGRPPVGRPVGGAQHPLAAPLVPGRGHRDRARRPDGCRRDVGRSMGRPLRRRVPARRHHAAGDVLHQLARPPRRERGATTSGRRHATAR